MMSVKRSLFTIAILAIAGLLVLCKKPGIPPDKPAIVSGPEHGGINVSYEFAATATHPDSGRIALRFNWGSRVSDWSAFIPSGDTVRMSNTWASAGTYAVKAQAKVQTGAESEWSEPHSVVITTNQPPNVPATPSGPSSAPKDSVCMFTAIATDPDGDGVAYRFDWGNGDTSGWTDWGPSGWPGVKTYSWRRGGTHSVRAQAKDAQETRSLWSNPNQITVRNQAPDTPSVPSGPSRGGNNRSYEFSSSATDPDGDSISIRFVWGHGDTSDWSALAPSGASVTGSHTWRTSGTYQVRAQASDEDGAVSGWSSPHDMTVAEHFHYLGRNAQGYDEYLCVADSALMIEIPAGWFTRGSNDGDPDELPVREIYLDAYLVDKYEVTNRQYKRFCDRAGHNYPPDPGFTGMPNYFTAYPDYPVVKVSWHDAKAYCDWAGKRLPTEAEWEKAARGTDARKYPWGNSEPDGTRCNIYNNPDGYDYTSPVGAFPAGVSPYGCLDMAGNVWEWCNDWYASDYYSQSPDRNPPGPSSGSYRVIRGGSWYYNAWFARCAYRGYVEPSYRDRSIGFRCSAHR